MRLITTLVLVLAVMAIVGSAAVVLTKDASPRLAVSVDGVPGYLYYGRAYEITIHYENLGGALEGPVELTAQLPETFALAERIDDAARHGELLRWTLDGLESRESGSVRFTVQGTLPDDLTAAVYDLPGYEGHTAFVEGFDLDVRLTAGSSTASALAIADTGHDRPLFSKAFAPNPITSGGASTLTFTIDDTNATFAADSLTFTDNLPAGVVVANPANASTTCSGGTLTAVAGSGVISYSGGSVSAGATCTISVDVASNTAGAHVNVTGDLTSNWGNSGSASDTLNVDPAPTVEPTATLIPTATPEFVPDPVNPLPTSTATPTATPSPTQAPVATATVGPEGAVAGISPPSTGDAGLAGR